MAKFKAEFKSTLKADKTDDEVVVSAEKDLKYGIKTNSEPPEMSAIEHELESLCKDSEQMMNNSDLKDLNDLVDTMKSGIDFKALELSQSNPSE